MNSRKHMQAPLLSVGAASILGLVLMTPDLIDSRVYVSVVIAMVIAWLVLVATRRS
jgi:hypothetical protein